MEKPKDKLGVKQYKYTYTILYANSDYYFNDYKIYACSKATKTRTRDWLRLALKKKSIPQTFLGE